MTAAEIRRPRPTRAAAPPTRPRRPADESAQARAARLHDVVRRVVETLDDVVHVNVDLGDGHPVDTAGPGDAAVSDLDQRLRTLEDGPTTRAARTRRTLSTGTHELRATWPDLAAAAAAVGVRSVLAVPVPLPGPPAAVTLYRRSEGELDAATRAVVALLSDAVALVATERAAVESAARLREQFSDALRWRAPIEQAKGILMALHRVDAETAFTMLRSESQSTNTRMRDLVTRFLGTTCGPAAEAACESACGPPAPVPATSHDFRSAFALAPVAMAVTDLDGGVLEANDALGRLLGRSPAELRGTALLAHTHPADRAAAATVLDGLRSGAATECVVDTRLQAAGPEPTAVPVTLAVAAQLDPHGGPTHLTVHVTDRSTEHALAERVRWASQHDPLTALPHRCLLAHLTAGADDRHGTDDPVSVLYLDVDRFKDVNDTHGHAVGDAVLVELARRLESAVRPGDTVARSGGDEFVVLCPATTAPDARALAARIGDTLAAPVALGATSLVVRVSVGTATSTGGESVEDLLHAADTAMYVAKRAPGARS